MANSYTDQSEQFEATQRNFKQKKSFSEAELAEITKADAPDDTAFAEEKSQLEGLLKEYVTCHSKIDGMLRGLVDNFSQFKPILEKHPALLNSFTNHLASYCFPVINIVKILENPTKNPGFNEPFLKAVLIDYMTKLPAVFGTTRIDNKTPAEWAAEQGFLGVAARVYPLLDQPYSEKTKAATSQWFQPLRAAAATVAHTVKDHWPKPR